MFSKNCLPVRSGSQQPDIEAPPNTDEKIWIQVDLTGDCK